MRKSFAISSTAGVTLFRPELQLAEAFLHQAKSPLAPRFHEAVSDPHMGILETKLEQQGYAVKDMGCYKALTENKA